MRITSIDIETTGLDHTQSQVLQVGAVIFDTSMEEFTPLGTYNKCINHPRISGEHFAIQMNVDIIRKIIELQNMDKKRNSIMYQLSKHLVIKPNVGDPNYDDWNSVTAGLKIQLDSLDKQLESQFIESSKIAVDFKNWLVDNGGYYITDDNKKHLNITGKNYWVFDNRFLEMFPDWNSNIRPHRRSFDPANLYAKPDDNVLPSLGECKIRALEQAQTYKSLNKYVGLFENVEVTHDALDDAIDVAKLVFFSVKRDEYFQHLINEHAISIKL